MQRRAQSKPCVPSGRWTAPIRLWRSSNIWMLFTKRGCVSSGPWTATLIASCRWLNKLPLKIAENFTARSIVSTPFLFSCSCLHLANKWTWQPFCYVILFVRLNVEAIGKAWRAGETESASLSVSLQSSFMPLRLAKRLTLGTLLSLLTLLAVHSNTFTFSPGSD